MASDHFVRLTTLLAVALVALAIVVVYLSVDDNVINVTSGPFTPGPDGAYIMNGHICEGTCPETLTPGVSLYMRTGSIKLGDIIIKSRLDGSCEIRSNNTILAVATKKQLALGNVLPAPSLSGVVLVGQATQEVEIGDFADVLSTTTVTSPENETVQIQQIYTRVGTGRPGWRVRTRDDVFSFVYGPPGPQVYIGFPSESTIWQNQRASVIDGTRATTLSAYDCVEDKFETTQAVLQVEVHSSPSTCFAPIPRLVTLHKRRLDRSSVCISRSVLTNVLVGGVADAVSDQVCFGRTACIGASSGSIDAFLRHAASGNVSAESVTVTTGCTDNTILVTCTRSDV